MPLKSINRRRLIGTTALLPAGVLFGPAARAESGGQEGNAGSSGQRGRRPAKGRNPASAQSATNPFFQPIGSPFDANQQAAYHRGRRITRDTELKSD